MREELDIITAYQKVGTYRGAADICGTTHKTVKRVVERHAAGQDRPVRAPRPANYEDVRTLVAQDVKDTRGRISAKRLLPRARAAGYTGSARNFRRLVAQEKKAWRAQHGRTHRPASWSPGEHLVIDWGVIAGVHVFAAVLAWSRFRFVRFATHYRFRPDFCEAADPESKGIVEALVRYGKDDLARPLILEHAGSGDLAAGAARVLADLGGANQRAADWCAEVNAALHSEIAAVPDQRLAKEVDLLTELPSLRPLIGPAPVRRKVDKLSTIRLGSARYSVPTALIGTQVGVLVDGARVLILDVGTGEVHAEHPLVGPGEASVLDEHYGGARPPVPVRAIRPRSAAEKDFCSLGPAAEAFIAGAAGAGHTRLGPELAELNTLTAAHGQAAMVAALERATAFGRWKASDVRSILAAGTGVPTPRPAGDALVIDLPTSTGRSLAEYAPATKAVSS